MINFSVIPKSTFWWKKPRKFRPFCYNFVTLALLDSQEIISLDNMMDKNNNRLIYTDFIPCHED